MPVDNEGQILQGNGKWAPEKHGKFANQVANKMLSLDNLKSVVRAPYTFRMPGKKKYIIMQIWTSQLGFPSMQSFSRTYKARLAFHSGQSSKAEQEEAESTEAVLTKTRCMA